MNGSKPKILFIMHVPPPVNGASVVGKNIKNSTLINEHFEADYINLTTAFSLEEIGKGGLRKFYTLAKIQRRIVKALRTKNYDLCYVTLTAGGSGFYKDIFIVSLLKLFRKNLIFHFHNKGIARFSNKATNRNLCRFVFKNTKSILLSPLLYPDISNFVHPEDVFFCPNGIEVSTDTGRSPIKSTAQKVNILFLSNMMKEKGVLDLLNACDKLNKKGLDFVCHFVGAWSDITEADFTQAVSRMNLEDKVQAHGKKYGGDKDKFLEAADIFVLPTFYHNECLPLVLLEAMAMGLPIISTFEGAIPEVVLDGETGLLYQQRNVEALVTSLNVLIPDPDKRKVMGARGRRRFEENFTLKIFEENLSAIFKKAIKDYQ